MFWGGGFRAAGEGHRHVATLLAISTPYKYRALCNTWTGSQDLDNSGHRLREKREVLSLKRV